MNDLQFMPHQEEVLNMTDDKNRCAYYLDMGLGKTFVGAEKMYLLNNTVNLIVLLANVYLNEFDQEFDVGWYPVTSTLKR